MRKINLLIIMAALTVFGACSGKKGADSGNNSGSTKKCDGINKIEKFTFKGEDLKFDVKHAICDMIQGATYRIILTNYDDPDKRSSEIKEGEKKIVIALTKPEGGKYAKGIYTYGNDGNKINKVSFSFYNGNARNKTFNLSNVINAGKVDVSYLDAKNICGIAQLKGQEGSELKVSFNAEDK